MKYDIFISCMSEDYNMEFQVYEFHHNCWDTNLKEKGFRTNKELSRQNNVVAKQIIF